MRLQTLLAVVAPFVVVSLATGCSSSTTVTPADAGTTGTDGGGDAGAGEACSVAVTIKGAPAGATPKVTLTGPAGAKSISADGSVELTAGDYTLSADAITTPDPLVRTVYRASFAPSPVHCDPAAPASLEVTFAPVASSNKLWLSNANGTAQVLGYASSALAATTSEGASVVADTAGAKSLAFDREGNLWAIGSTTVDPTLLRYPASSLGASGKPVPDRKIDVKNSGCSPSATGIAFDKDGNLWLSQLCDKQVVRLAASELAQDGEVTPTIAIGGMTGPAGVAFDKDGNLWVSDGVIRRYDAARLGASTTDAADAVLTIANADSEAVAFDKDGNLWSQGGSQWNVSRVAKTDLAAAGARDVTPAVTISVGVNAISHGIAFDESGGLWLATSAGKFARLAPTQLGTSTTYAAPTVPEREITSSDIGSADWIAFYPAPAGLPLYDALP